jgi:hypothetical protein
MNYGRLFLAALGAFVAYFAIGGAAFSAGPLKAEFSKYPAVYRPQNEIMSVMPFGMIAMFVAMVVMAALYAQIYRGPSSVADGAKFGALIGIFAVCAFVIHNHVNLNIGLGLTMGQAIAYFVEWTACGVVIALIYR